MGNFPGHCHCGLQAFEFRTTRAPADWPVRACQCSFCLMRNAIYTSDPEGELHWKQRDDAQMIRYRFGQETADFLFCGHCGSFLGAEAEIDGGVRAVVNVQVLDPPPAGMAEPQAVSFDGESTAGRESRHAARWSRVSR